MKQLPLIYMEKCLFLDPKNNLSGFSEPLRHVLLREAPTNPAQSADVHRPSSNLWLPDAEVLSVGPGKGGCGASPCPGCLLPP